MPTTALSILVAAATGVRPQSDPDDDEWGLLALCAQTDPDAFFPEKGQSAEPGRDVCRSCPVLRQCLQQALDDAEQYGTFGALTVAQRHRLNRALTIGDQDVVAELSEVTGVDLSGLRPNQAVASLQEVRTQRAARRNQSTTVGEERIAG